MSIALRFALLSAIVATPAAAASAGVVNTPIFACIDAADPAAGGMIYWTNGITFEVPTVELALDGQEPSAAPMNCSDGQFSEPLARKGDGSFVNIKFNDILTSGGGGDTPPKAPPPPPPPPKKFEIDTSGGSPIRWSVFQQQTLIGDVVFMDTHFDVFIDYVSVSLDNLGFFVDRSSNFLGLRFRTQGAFTGLDSVVFDYDLNQGALVVRAPLQAFESRVTLYGEPAASVPEPGTLGLMLAALMGIGVCRRLSVHRLQAVGRIGS